MPPSPVPPQSDPAPRRRRGRWLAHGLLVLVAPWSIGALYFDLHPAAPKVLGLAAYVAILVLLLKSSQGAGRRLLLGLLLNGAVVAWWLGLKPDGNQDWAPEVARMPWAERSGDRVTVHDVRNFSYRTEQDFDPRWETRTYDLGALVGADLFLTHWGAPLIAHSMVSFRFADGSYLATSIEARRTRAQEYSALRGFYRQFQLIYLVADERDVVRVRTNYRVGENVYLYRTRLKPVDARALFEAYLGWMNATRVNPAWYNALTRNCSTPLTAYLAQARIGGISRWDWRGVLDGSGDQMLDQLGDLEDGHLPFDRLKAQAYINPVARQADRAPDFSARIRAGRVGFGAVASPSP